MPPTNLGWADLVRIRQAGGPMLMEAAAGLLGLERRPRPQPTAPSSKSAPEPTIQDRVAPPAEPTEAQGTQIAPMPQLEFWMPTELRPLETDGGPDLRDRTDESGNPRTTALPVWATRPKPARLTHLSPWPALVPRLRHSLAVTRPTHALDLPRIVARLGRGELLHRLPRTTTRRWGAGLQIIEDHSRRLAPYWQDQALAAGRLARLFPAHAIVHAVIDEALQMPPRLCRQGITGAPYAPPVPGGALVVLGDLGVLADEAPWVQAFWSALGRQVSQAGGRAVALVPFAPSTAPDAIKAHWTLIPWERSAIHLTAAGRAGQVERLLQALAVSIRVEPGLLREVRRLLGLDAAAEAVFWQHAAVTSQSSVAATLDPAALKARRANFDGLGALRQAVWKSLCAWHAGLPDAVFISEAAQLSERSANDLLSPEERVLLLEFFDVLSRQLGGDDEPAGAAAWFLRLERRARKQKEPIWHNPAVQRIWARLHAQEAAVEPPPGLQPGDIASDPGDETLVIGLAQHGPRLGVQLRAAPLIVPGSPLGHMTTLNRWIGLGSFLEQPDRDPAFWADGTPPSWARAWGWDEHGAWVEFSIEGRDGQTVTQRMRWIEPGPFMMGSPEDEPDRYRDEGPRHVVKIRDGFWLFDTACTQSLWEAVTGKNRSRFKGRDRPVEQVSWDDVQRFIEAINTRLPGVGLSLPSETRWEFACRAGTVTPFSFGDTITPEQVNCDGRQYPYVGGEPGLCRGETLPVKALPPNDWGLYQMHGNVREWVQDAWHATYEGAPRDGSAWDSTASSAARVVRGGSWDMGARYCRSAYRYGIGPGYRAYYLGFRCARVHGREPGRPDVERAEPACPSLRSGSGRDRTDLTRGARRDRPPPVLLHLDADVSAAAKLPDTTELEIRSDRDTLVLRRITRPDWASAMGRDRFGLWAEIRIEPEPASLRERRGRESVKKVTKGVSATTSEPVIQRLRWIPPGRFLMGSPKDEPGRWEAEGPQHPVTLRQGYWLFDTPCTQALWVALGLKNPSHFQDPGRPVERVSWNDIQKRFLPALNERIPGFVLPTEAQWECACRAGTESALYTGSIEILGNDTAPTLDGIAWYGGNSSVGFELEEGAERGWLSDPQYPEAKAGTHAVGRKAPNRWGLYDMLGNVFEWVQDAWHDSYEGAPTDGSASEAPEAPADRVVRGGSWGGYARYCRSAYRYGGSPDDRDVTLGFRCARAQE